MANIAVQKKMYVCASVHAQIWTLMLVYKRISEQKRDEESDAYYSLGIHLYTTG